MWVDGCAVLFVVHNMANSAGMCRSSKSKFQCCQNPTIFGKSEIRQILQTRLRRIQIYRSLHKALIHHSLLSIIFLHRSKQMHIK